ncbi:MAG TPA: hypothetical protein VLL52_16080 [Anaerolineae bacterium]|nr:hypothetical protein [Anaerolineae bacterium]
MTPLRIYFKGEYRFDPPTANNNRVEYILDPMHNQLTPEWSQLSDQEIRRRMMTLRPKIDRETGQKVEHFPAYWNYFGNNSFWFTDAIITGAHLFDHQEPIWLQDDPLLGTPVTLKGHKYSRPAMIQSDPTGATSAQIFSAALHLGNDDNYCLAQNPSRAFLRCLQYPRHLDPPDIPAGTSAIFHSTVQNNQIRLQNNQNSTILNTLQQAIDDGYHLTFTYCLYYSPPYTYTEQELAPLFAQGDFRHNLKTGQMIGFINLTKEYALTSVPTGRLLQSPRPFDMRHPQNLTLGPAYITVDNDHNLLHLNTLSTFPEIDANLQKADLGDVTLYLQDEKGHNYTIATLTYDDYNQTAYEKTSGMIYIPIPPSIKDLLPTSQLYLQVSQPDKFAPNPVLVEESYDVETDNRVIYMNMEENEDTLTVQLFHHGQPAANVPVTVSQWSSTATNIPDSIDSTDEKITHEPTQIYDKPHQALHITPTEGVTDAHGRFTFHLTATNIGVARLYFGVPGAKDVPQDQPDFFSTHRHFYTTVRVLPADDHLDAIENPDWATVYENVLRVYYIIYPGTSEHFPLNNEVAVRQNAKNVLQRMHPSLWHSTLYMPTSRDMSPGKRRLLQRWLQQQPPTTNDQ